MHDQPDLFDGLESRAARDAGIASVLDHYAGWKDRALAMIVTLPRHTGPFEDWRRMLREAGLSEPPDFHAWGGLSNACQKGKILVRTGRFVHMRAVRSHARITPELTTGEGYGCG